MASRSPLNAKWLLYLSVIAVEHRSSILDVELLVILGGNPLLILYEVPLLKVDEIGLSLL
jgi:hypothetical protein